MLGFSMLPDGFQNRGLRGFIEKIALARLTASPTMACERSCAATGPTPEHCACTIGGVRRPASLCLPS